MIQKRTAILAPLAALVVVLSACSGGQVHSASGARQIAAHAAYGTEFRSLHDLVDKSDEVIIGKIIAEQRGPVTIDVDAREQLRILKVSTERVIKGSPGETIDVTVPGWTTLSDGREYKFIIPDGIRLEVGDRALMALLVDENSGERGGANNEAFYVLIDGEVQDTHRKHPLAQQIEGMTEREAERALRETK